MLNRGGITLGAAVLGTFLSTILGTAGAFAQPAPPPSVDLPVDFDSGWVQADVRPGEPLGGPAVVFSQVLEVDAPWLQLQFDQLVLSGSRERGDASILRVTSLLDNAHQRLDHISAEQWSGRSAFFNGGTLLIEILALPGTGPSRLVMTQVTAGEPPQPVDGGVASICFSVDDRELSYDPKDARTSNGCTAFLINSRHYCLLSAGHCNAANSIEFNVPLSNPDGTRNWAHPNDQYAVDQSSKQIQNQPCGNDWMYFGVFPNSNTGLSPLQAQGESYQLAPAAPAPSGQSIRIRGYGTVSSPVPPQWNVVQKTHDGPYLQLTSGTQIGHQADTTGGNSGSAIYEYSTGTVIGIHTCGGCGASGGTNKGTAVHHSNLQNALANPQGVCAWPPPAEPSDVTVPGDYATIQAAINAVASGSIITVAPGTYAEAINFLGKALTVVSSDGPEVTIIDATGLSASVVRFSTSETDEAVLDGFTLTGGIGTSVVIGGTSYVVGGGIYAASSSPTILNCIIAGNTAQFGGGMFNNGATPTIQNCVFENNAASPSSGGGIFNFSGSAAQISNTAFVGNSAAAHGGALSNQGSNPTVTNCDFSDNVATGNGGAVRNISSSAAQFIGCTFSGNIAGNTGGAIFNDASPSTSISGSIFCGSTPNHIAGSFENEGGNNFEDACGSPPVPGDLNGDGSVGVADLLILLGQWGPCSECSPASCPADLTGDCSVGVADLLILLASWG